MSYSLRKRGKFFIFLVNKTSSVTTGLDIQMVCACLSVVSFEKKFQIWVAVLIKQGTDTVKCSPMVTLFYRMGSVCCLFICHLFTAVANTTESVASTSNTVKK